MTDYEDDETIDRLKAFWDENGRFLVSAVVLSTAGLFGWNWWQGAQRAEAEGASQVYARAVEAAQSADLTMLVSNYNALVDEYPESPYRSQAALRLAGLYMQRGETEAAADTLRDVLALERGGLLEPLVASRLARVLEYRGDPAAALEVLDGIGDPGNYAPLLADVRGDVNVALGDVDAARAAYQAAIESPGQPQLVDVRLVEMKLADLDGAPAEATETP